MQRITDRLVLPNTQDLPAGLAKLGPNAEVTLHIAHDFGAPVIWVRFGNAPMVRTAMPKAPIDENGKAPLWECNIYLNYAFGQLHPVILIEA